MVRDLRGSRILAVAVVVLLLGAVYGLAGLRHMMSLSAGSAPRSPRLAAVSSVQRVCPAPGTTTSPASGIAVMSAPAGSGSSQAGAALNVTRLTGTGSAAAGPRVLSVTQPGVPRLAQVTVDRTTARKTTRTQPGTGTGTGTGTRTGTGTKQTAGTKKKTGTQQKTPTQQTSALAATAVGGGVVIQASGSLAQGLEAEQTSAGSLPTAACTSPGTNFWFTGAGQRTASRIELYLMNAGSQVADVAVDIATDAGPLQETTDTGISVPPHGMIVQSLATTLHNSRAISLHVRTSVGQVAAAVEESTAGGAATWLPAAQPPARSLVVPGLPGVAGTRQLYIAVPGVKDATVKVTAVTSRGSYQPTGASGIDLPGGSAAEITVPSLGGIPAALRLTANTPVTASVLIPGGGGALGAFTAAAPAIEEQGVVADNLTGPGRSSTLVLSAPRGAARVTVAEIASAGSATRQTQNVPVPAGKSVVVSLRAIRGAPRGTPFAVVIMPQAGSGPVYAGRVIMGNGAGAALQAMLPVASALTTVPLPPVHQAAITASP
ncbi:MAG TPA: DUF5719 family protein [Streptosporangiaceae bacterium]